MTRWASEQKLEDFYTKQLLDIMHVPWMLGYYGFTKEQIKVELATREHVPNKIEARKIRQAKAKAQRNR